MLLLHPPAALGQRDLGVVHHGPERVHGPVRLVEDGPGPIPVHQAGLHGGPGLPHLPPEPLHVADAGLGVEVGPHTEAQHHQHDPPEDSQQHPLPRRQPGHQAAPGACVPGTIVIP